MTGYCAHCDEVKTIQNEVFKGLIWGVDVYLGECITCGSAAASFQEA